MKTIRKVSERTVFSYRHVIVTTTGGVEEVNTIIVVELVQIEVIKIQIGNVVN